MITWTAYRNYPGEWAHVGGFVLEVGHNGSWVLRHIRGEVRCMASADGLHEAVSDLEGAKRIISLVFETLRSPEIPEKDIEDHKDVALAFCKRYQRARALTGEQREDALRVLDERAKIYIEKHQTP